LPAPLTASMIFNLLQLLIGVVSLFPRSNSRQFLAKFVAWLNVILDMNRSRSYLSKSAKTSMCANVSIIMKYDS
jgi:hypothetical protein